MPIIDAPVVRSIPSAFLSLVFPDDCRVCGTPLQTLSRIPVCAGCLAAPTPFVAEHFCGSCGTPFVNSAPLDEQGRCGLCRRGLTSFDTAHTFGEYDGALRKLIHLLKYGGVQPLAEPLGRLLLSAVPRTQRFDVVVPMPLHWRRRLKRGFNQAELLARRAGRGLNAEVRQALVRTRATPPQAGLTLAQRKDNVAGAFRVGEREAVEGRHVLLIDDVLTTGATVAAAAGALKRCGARRVTVATLARADRRKTALIHSRGRESSHNEE